MTKTAGATIGSPANWPGRLARGLTEAVIKALRERLTREKGRKRGRRLSAELRAIGERVAALRVLDRRTPEEILDYDERGVPR